MVVYWPASPCCLASRYDNPMPQLTLSPQSGYLNLATGKETAPTALTDEQSPPSQSIFELTCHGEACDDPGGEEAGVAGCGGRQKAAGRHQDVGHKESRLPAQLVSQKSEQDSSYKANRKVGWTKWFHQLA